MTTRQFDPVFSAALRNELEALADVPEAAPAPRPVLRRPQVWITVVTALVLALASVGLLRLTEQRSQPADPATTVVDPLTRLTDPASPYYVARSLTTLLSARGSGPGSRTFDVPGDVSHVRVYLNCSGRGMFRVEVDTAGELSSRCDRDSGSNASSAVEAGRHTASVSVRKGVAWALTIIRTPAPTVSDGPLVDPLAAVRDLRNPDALTGDTTPLLRLTGSGDETTRFPLPADAGRMRVFFVCRSASSSAQVRIGTQPAVLRGCMNSIAHWLDVSTSNPSIAVDVTAPGTVRWSLLAVPAPEGAEDSPASTTLPYPEVPGALLGRARGGGATVTGTYRRPGTVLVTTTCRGTGWLEISLGEDATTTRGTPCSTTTPNAVGFGGEEAGMPQRRWTVTPHGDVSWTFQLSNDG